MVISSDGDIIVPCVTVYDTRSDITFYDLSLCHPCSTTLVMVEQITRR